MLFHRRSVVAVAAHVVKTCHTQCMLIDWQTDRQTDGRLAEWCQTCYITTAV